MFVGCRAIVDFDCPDIFDALVLQRLAVECIAPPGYSDPHSRLVPTSHLHCPAGLRALLVPQEQSTMPHGVISNGYGMMILFLHY